MSARLQRSHHRKEVLLLRDSGADIHARQLRHQCYDHAVRYHLFRVA